MRKIRIFEHTSLDGVIQHGGGRNEERDFPYGDWTAPYRSPAGAAAVVEAQGERFDLLLGRRTYDIWSGYWPKVTEGPFAGAINAATKYVATHRPDSLAWGPVESLGDDIIEGIRRVKAADGPDVIVWGSSTLTPLLLDQGLVDDMLLMVYPIVLGRGKRFSTDRVNARAFALVSTKSTPTGVLINRYRHVGSVQVPD